MADANNTSANDVIFTMGLPGAGKSTTMKRLGFTSTHTAIDPDAVKESHPDYDPKNPEALHAWSKEVTERQWAQALKNGGRYIVDGTGTNAEKMVRKMRQAKAAGFNVRLVFVRVSLETALERNAARERTVPEHIVIEKSRDIKVAFDIVQREADTTVIVDND